ncbi:hypothetical protein AX17_000237 [Amanita inopinata Kibby_2008]|nr:hypothetical protein AX17_000237 [Amanita inopinata Kibby_2008]
MSPRVITVDRPWVKVGCTLGEGPLYDPKTHKLHFVDIAKSTVYHLDISRMELSSEQFNEPVTCLALRRNGCGLACAAAQGFAILEGNSILKYLSKPLPPEHAPYTRFNDGGCDAKGRFFAGTIHSVEHDVPGQLYRFDPQTGECIVVDEGPFTDCNGLGWSPDGATFYFTDSLVNKIHAYDYNDGILLNRRVYVDAVSLGFSARTYCDGLCIDDEGFVWSARWGGSRVIRYSKDGKIDLEIVFPTVLSVTACCFGGPNNDQLFVTTAHCGALDGDAVRQEKYPDSGHLFIVDLAGQYKGGIRCEFDG